METHGVLKRRFDALTGCGVIGFLFGFPFLAARDWSREANGTGRLVDQVSIVCLSILWLTLLAMIGASVLRLVHGRTTLFAGGAIVWIASIIAIVVTSWSPAVMSSAERRGVTPTSAVSTTVGPRPSATPTYRWVDHDVPDASASSDVNDVTPSTPNHSRAHDSAPALSVGAASGLPLALMAKRRRDYLTQTRLEPHDDDVDEIIASLRGFDEREIALIRHAIGTRPCGWVRIPHDAPRDLDADLDVPTVAVLVVADDAASVVAFAQPGYPLPLGPSAAALVDRTAAVVSRQGRCHIADTPEAALRALALRPDLSDVVVYLGPAQDLDDEVAQRCVTVGDAPAEEDARTLGVSWSFSDVSTTPRHARPSATPASDGVRVLLLRAEPVVTGLAEPFTPTLRRRCVEMTSYLAVHAGEPVTGERLRARVLGRGDDASVRTLANTASAVRRSLGSDTDGLRLHPVSPAGLYQVHGVSCDLVDFHRLVDAARDPRCPDAPGALARALELVDGEPLATALRGFEWFLAEGHLARLQRAGEWAALALATAAREEGDVDLAFWAIEQGRLIDPYSEALEAALHRIPRRRDYSITARAVDDAR